MSIKVMQAVLDCRDSRLKGPAKAVLLTIAWHANDLGVAYPSQELLAAEAGVTDRTVRNAISLAEGLGYLKAVGFYDHRRKRRAVNVYNVNLDALAAAAQVERRPRRGRTGAEGSRAHAATSDPASNGNRPGKGDISVPTGTSFLQLPERDSGSQPERDSGPYRNDVPENRQGEPSEGEPSGEPSARASGLSARFARSETLVARADRASRDDASGSNTIPASPANTPSTPAVEPDPPPTPGQERERRPRTDAHSPWVRRPTLPPPQPPERPLSAAQVEAEEAHRAELLADLVRVFGEDFADHAEPARAAS